VITILIATGVLSSGVSGGSSDVVTPTERTITLTRPGGAVQATQAIDPTDVMDFVLALQGLLASGETFATITLSVLSASAALGFTVFSVDPFAPEEVDDSHVRIWVGIDGASRGLSAWSGQGTACGIEITAVTDSTPPRTFQRTAQIKVVQK
jgi:hypothetical protein